jgi:hypothetical protein
MDFIETTTSIRSRQYNKMLRDEKKRNRAFEKPNIPSA